MTFEALLWDVDGTLAETERDGHRVAFNQAFAAAGLPWAWDVEHYGRLLAVTGGRERLLADFALRADAPADAAEREALARRLHVAKNAAYAGLVDDGCVALRPGVAELMDDCRRRGLRMAIATTTSRANVDALLRAQLGARWATAFDAVVCGEDVARKKPDPSVYVQALRGLGVDSAQALAIEDSPAGVAAARGAGIATLVTRSVYFADAAVPGALATGPGLHDVTGWRPATAARRGGPRRVDLDDLEHWHARHAGAPLMQPQPEHC